MKRSRIAFLIFVIPLFWGPVLTDPHTPEKGTIDLELAAQYFSEANAAFQIAKYRRQLVDGPILVLPLKRVKISFDPSSQVPLETYGRVYPKITIKDVWGVITVTNGALISFKEMRGAVMIEADQDKHPLTNDGWTLSLEEGWAVVPGEREGDLTIKKTDKYMVKDVYERVKLLASSEGELIWPGFDPSRYAEIRKDESDGTSYLALSNELEKPDPEFMIGISDRTTQKQSLAANLNLVFHEAFHCFQHDSERIGVQWSRESPRLIFRYGAITANNFTRFCIEAQLLWDALFAPDDESCRRAARQFIAVRRHRQAQMAPELVEFEKGAEANEGIATYVGIQAVKIGIKAQDQGRINLSLCESNPEKWVHSKLSSLEEMHELAGGIRRRFYYTGAAQAFILDRLSPGWKRRVQTEAAVLQNLIAEVLDAEEENDASIAEDVIIQKGFNALLKKIKDMQEKAMVKNRERADSILNFSGWKIIVDLEEFGHLASQINFAPNRVFIVDKYIRVHEIFLRVWEEGSFQAIFNKPVIEDEAALRYCSHVEPSGIPVVILDGKNLSLDLPGHFLVKKEATVSADRISLIMEAGTIIIKDKTVVLKVTTKKNN